MEWVLAATGGGVMLGWSLIELVSMVSRDRDPRDRDTTYAATNALAAFVGGMLLMWSFTLSERVWASTGMMIIGMLAGCFLAIACEALRFIAEINEEGR